MQESTVAQLQILLTHEFGGKTTSILPLGDGLTTP
jgi:hypothetical protein